MSVPFTDRTWLWIAAGFYLAGFLLGVAALLRGGRQPLTVTYFIIAAGYLTQWFGLYLRGMSVGGCPLGNSFEFLQFTAWSAITLYLVVGPAFRLSLLGYFSSCLAAALTLVSLAIPAWDSARRTGIFGNNPWIEFHAALALFSYGVFALLALTSLMLLFRNYALKSKHIGGWFAFLPSVLDLDHIGVRLLVTGVALLSLSLAVGAVYWLRDTSSAHSSKLLITFAIWAAYTATLVLRWLGRLVGRRFSVVCVGLFAAALLSLGPVNASRPAASPDSVIEE